ncbi:MAG: hypothetical protein WDO73_02360 [Ignavibacteriota bacterium]
MKTAANTTIRNPARALLDGAVMPRPPEARPKALLMLSMRLRNSAHFFCGDDVLAIPGALEGGDIVGEVLARAGKCPALCGAVRAHIRDSSCRS